MTQRYAVWMEASQEFVADVDAEVLKGWMLRDLWRKAERDGAAVDMGRAVLRITDSVADFFVRNRVAVLAEAPISYRFVPVADQFARLVPASWRAFLRWLL